MLTGVAGCRRVSKGVDGYISILTEVAPVVDGCRRMSTGCALSLRFWAMVNMGVDGCRRVSEAVGTDGWLIGLLVRDESAGPKKVAMARC